MCSFVHPLNRLYSPAFTTRKVAVFAAIPPIVPSVLCARNRAGWGPPFPRPLDFMPCLSVGNQVAQESHVFAICSSRFDFFSSKVFDLPNHFWSRIDFLTLRNHFWFRFSTYEVIFDPEFSGFCYQEKVLIKCLRKLIVSKWISQEFEASGHSPSIFPASPSKTARRIRFLRTGNIFACFSFIPTAQTRPKTEGNVGFAAKSNEFCSAGERNGTRRDAFRFCEGCVLPKMELVEFFQAPKMRLMGSVWSPRIRRVH